MSRSELHLIMIELEKELEGFKSAYLGDPKLQVRDYGKHRAQLMDRYIAGVKEVQRKIVEANRKENQKDSAASASPR